MPCPHGHDKLENCYKCLHRPLPPPLPLSDGGEGDTVETVLTSRETALAEADAAAAIDAQIIALCLAPSTSPELRRQILDVLKEPSAAKIHAIDPQFRPLVNRWLEMNSEVGLRARAREVRAQLKIFGPPRVSKSAEGTNYTANESGICSKISMIWLKQISTPISPDLKLKPKIQFYRSSSRESLALPTHYSPEIWTASWMRSMTPLLPPGSTSSNFIWTCEKIFTSHPVFAIKSCRWNDFHKEFANIISALEEKRYSGFFCIFSTTLLHTMAASAKPRNEYISVRFFDPNCANGEISIGLSLSPARERWEERLLALTQAAGVTPSNYSRLTGDADVTLVCLLENTARATDTADSFTMTNSDKELQGMAPNFRLLCLHGVLQNAGGEKGVYFNHALRLLKGLPVEFCAAIGRYTGTTLLFSAARNKYEKMVEILLELAEKRRDLAQNILETRITDSITPLFIAAQWGHEQVVALLLAFVRKMKDLARIVLAARSDGVTPFFIAAQLGHEKVVAAFLKFSERMEDLAPLVLAARSDGITPLFMAVQQGREQVVASLVNLASRNRKLRSLLLHSSHRTALLAAAKGAHRERIVTLIQSLFPEQTGN